MAKSSLEKQLEKQMKQAKQLADKQKREEQRNLREQKCIAEKEAVRQRASSIVNGQPLIEGFRIMDLTSEVMLKALLQSKPDEGMHINFEDYIFPDYVQMSLAVELEKLVQYGMIGGLLCFDNGGMLDLLPQAISYFSDKEEALKKQKETHKRITGSVYNNYGNMIFGDVSNSQLSVDNSINKISRAIDEMGGEDATALHETLEEIKELIENIESSRSIPKRKRLAQKIADHASKHGWFYGAVLQLLGTAAFNLIGNQ